MTGTRLRTARSKSSFNITPRALARPAFIAIGKFRQHKGGGRRLSVRAVKAAGLALIEAKRRALTEEAGGSGAAFSQEGQ